jgi:hypothetical protein
MYRKVIVVYMCSKLVYIGEKIDILKITLNMYLESLIPSFLLYSIIGIIV